MNRPTPFYDCDGVTIYCGDSREVLPRLPPGIADAIIVDPVWPNALPVLAGADDPWALFAAAAEHFPRLATRAAVHLGGDSDPRFLAAVPPELPFFRACWLEYARPHYKGRLLYTADVAYLFGPPPPSQKGAIVIPGKVVATEATRLPAHPCPRKLSHVKWLIRQWARGTVLDPFCGSGTTLLAAKQAGLPAIGIECNEAYCRAAVERLAQLSLGLEVSA